MNLFFNFYFLTPDIFLIFTSLKLLVIGSILSSNKQFGSPILTQVFFYLTIQILFFCTYLSFSQILIPSIIWNGFLISNDFTFLAKNLLFLFSFIIYNFSFSYLSHRRLPFFEYWVLSLLGISAISLVIHSFDLLSIYISLEFQSLVFYILASLNRTSEFSTEAGLKYFILGAFSSAFLLLGAALLYSLTGISNLGDFTKLFANFADLNSALGLGVTIGLTFILTAFLFKFNVAPFHFWSPDVYEGVPVPVTAFFATLPKLAIAGLLVKFLYFSFYNFLPAVDTFLLICCLCSSIIGIFGAFLQVKWKRFIAYSSIGHASFVLLSLLANDFFALNSIFMFLIIYVFTSLLYFLTVTNLCLVRFPKFSYSRLLTDSKQLVVNNGVLSSFILITMFSLAGIPPLAGFFSKLVVLMAAFKNNFFGLSIVIILLTCVASFYYLRFLKTLYFDNTLSHFILVPMNFLNAVSSVFCVTFIVFLFLDLDFLNAFTKLMVISLIK